MNNHPHHPRRPAIGQGPSEEALRDLFQASAPSPSGVDLESILVEAVAANARRRSGPRAWSMWTGVACLFFLISLSTGWLAGRSAATQTAQAADAEVALFLRQIDRAIETRLLQAEISLASTREQRLKQLALLLREDSREQIRVLEDQVERLEHLLALDPHAYGAMPGVQPLGKELVSHHSN